MAIRSDDIGMRPSPGHGTGGYGSNSHKNIKTNTNKNKIFDHDTIPRRSDSKIRRRSQRKNITTSSSSSSILAQVFYCPITEKFIEDPVMAPHRIFSSAWCRAISGRWKNHCYCSEEGSLSQSNVGFYNGRTNGTVWQRRIIAMAKASRVSHRSERTASKGRGGRGEGRGGGRGRRWIAFLVQSIFMGIFWFWKM